MKSFGVRLRVKKIKISSYVKLGPMLVLREALEPNHPELPYNWIKNNIGVDPEDFGIMSPYHFDRNPIDKEYF